MFYHTAFLMLKMDFLLYACISFKNRSSQNNRDHCNEPSFISNYKFWEIVWWLEKEL